MCAKCCSFTLTMYTDTAQNHDGAYKKRLHQYLWKWRYVNIHIHSRLITCIDSLNIGIFEKWNIKRYVMVRVGIEI